MNYFAIIEIDNDEAKAIENYLTVEPETEEHGLGLDETITHTATFDNGFKMDIKCCGVSYRPGESNTAWTEAVLFDQDNNQCCCTDPEYEYLGPWELNYDDNTYQVNVVVKADKTEEADI